MTRINLRTMCSRPHQHGWGEIALVVPIVLLVALALTLVLVPLQLVKQLIRLPVTMVHGCQRLLQAFRNGRNRKRLAAWLEARAELEERDLVTISDPITCWRWCELGGLLEVRWLGASGSRQPVLVELVSYSVNTLVRFELKAIGRRVELGALRFLECSQVAGQGVAASFDVKEGRRVRHWFRGAGLSQLGRLTGETGVVPALEASGHVARVRFACNTFETEGLEEIFRLARRLIVGLPGAGAPDRAS